MHLDKQTYIIKKDSIPYYWKPRFSLQDKTLTQRVENIGISEFKVTGKNDGLFIIKIPYRSFDNVPPYILP
jgi:hypothetical protein